MITEIKNENAPTMVLKCAVCGASSEVPLAALTLGAVGNPNMIVPPPCPQCRSQEILFRTFDGDDDEHAAHRKAVNAIGIYLKGAGKVDPSVAAVVTAEAKPPTLTRPLLGPV